MDNEYPNCQNNTDEQPAGESPAPDAEASGEHVAVDHREAPADERDGEKLVPVSEAKRYRRRAQAAERQLAAVQEMLEASEAALQDTRQEARALREAQRVDDLLIEAGAIDLETTRLLTEVALSDMEKPEVLEAVAEVHRRKPFLFRNRCAKSGALGPKNTAESRSDRHVERAAVEAGTTGRRSDLLRYLRLKRRT
jgi:hypothetical protein